MRQARILTFQLAGDAHEQKNTCFSGSLCAGTIRALYGRAQSGSCSLVGCAACITNGLGAQQSSLGYSYTLSKRTDLYGFYTRVANDSGTTYQFANAAGIGAAASTTNTGYALGMRHTF